MKKIYLLLLATAFGLGSANAQTVCATDPAKAYFTNNNGWTNSEYYEIINIDPQNLGTNSIAKHSGTNGTQTSSTFSTGSFNTPIMAYNETTSQYEASSVMWPVNYFMTCVADTFHNSAWTKKYLLGTADSSKGDACYSNDNSVIADPAFDKVAFFELSRLSDDVTNAPGVSRHGYIQIDNLPAVERVQWSFSSTAWKRGVKLDIKHGDGEWEPLQWEASDISTSINSFSERGYSFENVIGKQEELDSRISLRWRIWDGDTIHQNPTQAEGVLFAIPIVPTAQKQVVRIHQIKIFSGVTPTEAPNAVIENNYNFRIYRSGNAMISTESGIFSVYTPEGKLIRTAQGDRIELGNLNKGIYILKMNSVNGNSQVEKVIL